MKFFRRMAPPVAMAVTTVGAVFSGLPLDIAGLMGTAIGQTADRLLPVERPRSIVNEDVANRGRRAIAFEQYGASVAVAWRSAGILMTLKTKWIGMLHPLLMLMREQRRFENETAAALAALSSILLYASTETQQSAINLYRMFGDQLVELGKHRQGSQGARKAFDDGSFKIGDCVVAWRATAQADLAGPNEIL